MAGLVDWWEAQSEAGVVERTRSEGKSVFYRVREGDLTVALGLR
jgi:hypothetical protein